jgi:hypothetical protein
MNLARKILRETRIFHVALLFATILYFAFLTLVIKVRSQSASQIFPVVIGFAALTSLAAASFLRSRQLPSSSEALRDNPEDVPAARRWRAGVITSLVFCESVVLFGLVLRLIGVSWNVSAIFYAVGILVMLAWTPKLDLPPQ